HDQRAGGCAGGRLGRYPSRRQGPERMEGSERIPLANGVGRHGIDPSRDPPRVRSGQSSWACSQPRPRLRETSSGQTARRARGPPQSLRTPSPSVETPAMKPPMALPVVGEQDFEREVLRSELPVLIDFYADWCGPCKTVAPEVEALAHELEGKAKVVKVDI